MIEVQPQLKITLPPDRDKISISNQEKGIIIPKLNEQFLEYSYQTPYGKIAIKNENNNFYLNKTDLQNIGLYE